MFVNVSHGSIQVRCSKQCHLPSIFGDCLETFLCCWYLIIHICFGYNNRSEYVGECFQNIDCAHPPNIAMLWHNHYKVSVSDHQMPLRDLVLRTPLYTIVWSKDLMIVKPYTVFLTNKNGSDYVEECFWNIDYAHQSTQHRATLALQ